MRRVDPGDGLGGRADSEPGHVSLNIGDDSGSEETAGTHYRAGVFLPSMATRVLELSWIRVLSVSRWYHFGFLVIVAKTSPARASGYPTLAATGPIDVLGAWIETGSPGRVRAATMTFHEDTKWTCLLGGHAVFHSLNV